MDVGELFFIADPRLDLEGRVLWAASSYEKKYGQVPTLCLVHTSLLKGKGQRLGRLRLEGKKSILPNYLWIGVTGNAARPLAR